MKSILSNVTTRVIYIAGFYQIGQITNKVYIVKGYLKTTLNVTELTQTNLLRPN